MNYEEGSYEQDREWSDGFNESIQAILGDHLMKEIGKAVVAAPIEDMRRATDFQVVFSLKPTDLKVAARMRRVDQLRYTDVTVRSWRLSGAETELAKFKEKAVRWFFYGWAGPGKNSIYSWVILDMDKVVSSGVLEGKEEIPNKGGLTKFIKITKAEIMARGLLAAQHNWISRAAGAYDRSLHLARLESEGWPIPPGISAQEYCEKELDGFFLPHLSWSKTAPAHLRDAACAEISRRAATMDDSPESPEFIENIRELIRLKKEGKKP